MRRSFAGLQAQRVRRVLGAKDEIFCSLIAREVHRLIDHAVRLYDEPHATTMESTTQLRSIMSASYSEPRATSLRPRVASQAS